MSPNRRRAFRPSVGENTLEERQVLSRLGATALVSAQAVPVTNAKAISQTVTAVHNAYTVFLSNETKAYRAAVTAVNRGTKTEAQALNDLIAYTSKQVDYLERALRTASLKLPYGAGYSPRPSGGPSLWEGYLVPIAETFRIQNTDPGDPTTYVATLADAGAALSTTAVRLAYNASQQAIKAYVIDGVNSGDFRVK